MTSHSVAAKPASSRFRFFTGIWYELKKVVWLSRREAAYLTMMVLVVTIAAGIVLYAFDLGFSTAIDKLLLGK
ncbi:MAG: preprotein translocase subunit SecE [Dehalococcoidales bacterium]|nr:preprotein translocase subunit SecE [Dehalococcoidales bacterium]